MMSTITVFNLLLLFLLLRNNATTMKTRATAKATAMTIVIGSASAVINLGLTEPLPLPLPVPVNQNNITLMLSTIIGYYYVCATLIKRPEPTCIIVYNFYCAQTSGYSYPRRGVKWPQNERYCLLAFNNLIINDVDQDTRERLSRYK